MEVRLRWIEMQIHTLKPLDGQCYPSLARFGYYYLGKKITVELLNNSPAFKGSPLIKVNILRSQMVVFNVISPFFKGYPEIKVKNLQSQWDQ